jgi:hypothetical protein
MEDVCDITQEEKVDYNEFQRQFRKQNPHKKGKGGIVLKNMNLFWVESLQRGKM